MTFTLTKGYFLVQKPTFWTPKVPSEGCPSKEFVLLGQTPSLRVLHREKILQK